MPLLPPVRRVDDGVTVAIRLTPNAKTNGFHGMVPRQDAMAIKVSVTAAPERNKANNALLALLAKAWRVPKSAMRIASGQTDRNKMVHIDGNPDDLQKTFNGWMATQHD